MFFVMHTFPIHGIVAFRVNCLKSAAYFKTSDPSEFLYCQMKISTRQNNRVTSYSLSVIVDLNYF